MQARDDAAQRKRPRTRSSFRQVGRLLLALTSEKEEGARFLNGPRIGCSEATPVDAAAGTTRAARAFATVRRVAQADTHDDDDDDHNFYWLAP